MQVRTEQGSAVPVKGEQYRSRQNRLVPGYSRVNSRDQDMAG